MIGRSISLMLVLAIAACSAPAKHPPNTDTVALLRTVVRYASATLNVGPKIAIARTPKSNASTRMSLATQNALVSSDSTLSAVDRYDVAHQVCDTPGTPASCHFSDADGLIAVRDVLLWRDSARVGIEYYRTTPVGTPAKTGAKKTLVYSTGDASLERDVAGHWKVRNFTETGGGAKH